MKYAAIGPIAVHLPETVETNAELKAAYPSWDMDLIYTKTGIGQRHLAAPGECASDLGVAAAGELFARYQIDPARIDFLLLCTQTPDYPLPTTACLMQERLGLPTSAGPGFQPRMFRLRVRLGPGGRIDSRGCGAASVVDHRRDVFEVHPSGRSQSPDDLWRWNRPRCWRRSMVQHLRRSSFGTDGRGADTLLVTKRGPVPRSRPSGLAIVIVGPVTSTWMGRA